MNLLEKGETANPNGRPKKLPQLDELLAEVMAEEKDGITAAQAILMALRARASKGDVRAAELLLDRSYGKLKQEIKHEVSTAILSIDPLDDTAHNSVAENSPPQ